MEQGFAATIDDLIKFEQFPDAVDSWIQQSGYVNVTTRNGVNIVTPRGIRRDSA